MSKAIKEFKQLNNREWEAKTEDEKCIIITYKDNYISIYFGRKLEHKEFYPTLGLDTQVNTDLIKKMLKFNGFTFQTEKTYDVDYENFKDNNTAEAFQHWWNEEGSSFTAEECEDPEEFMKRICGIAWNNGSFKGGEDE